MCAQEEREKSHIRAFMKDLKYNTATEPTRELRRCERERTQSSVMIHSLSHCNGSNEERYEIITICFSILRHARDI